MFIRGIAFFIGLIFKATAMNLTSLIVGRFMLGVGVGFANQAKMFLLPPLLYNLQSFLSQKTHVLYIHGSLFWFYLSEMAPLKNRGALSIGFQMAVTIGILTACLINYGTAKIEGEWEWRVSSALPGVPALVMVMGAVLLPDTPNSMIERGYTEKAKLVLRTIRGTKDLKNEFNDLVAASEAAKKVGNPWRNILEPRHRPQLVIWALIPFFQQLTGINIILFYAPVLLKTLGFGENASLMTGYI